MPGKIILKKKKKKYLIALVQKHKIKDVIGFFNFKEFFIDINKLKEYSNLGCSFSYSAMNVIYKELSKYEKHEESGNKF